MYGLTAPWYWFILLFYVLFVQEQINDDYDDDDDILQLSIICTSAMLTLPEPTHGLIRPVSNSRALNLGVVPSMVFFSGISFCTSSH